MACHQNKTNWPTWMFGRLYTSIQLEPNWSTTAVDEACATTITASLIQGYRSIIFSTFGWTSIHGLWKETISRNWAIIKRFEWIHSKQEATNKRWLLLEANNTDSYACRKSMWNDNGGERGNIFGSIQSWWKAYGFR